jgi:hypothetical protein
MAAVALRGLYGPRAIPALFVKQKVQNESETLAKPLFRLTKPELDMFSMTCDKRTMTRPSMDLERAIALTPFGRGQGARPS